MGDDFRLQGKIELQDDSQAGVQQFESSLRQMQGAVKRLNIANDIAKIQTDVAKATGQGLHQAVEAQKKILQQIMAERGKALSTAGVDPDDSAARIMERLSGKSDKVVEKTLRLKKGYEEVRRELTRVDQSMEGIRKKHGGGHGAMGDMAELMGLQELRAQLQMIDAAIGRVWDNTVTSFSERQRSQLGIASIARAFGQDIGAVNEAARRAASDGVLPLTTATTALRDLLTAGLSVEQASQLLVVFKDRAALARSETVSYEQAVENLAQSFKTEQSEIGNLSGMTENYSKIIEAGARAMNKQVSALTEAERAQAKYLGILQMSAGFLGGASIMADSVAGSQARADTASKQLAATIGQSLSPVVTEYNNILAQGAQRVTEWVDNHQGAARQMALITTGAVKGAAAVTGLVVTWRLASTAFTAAGLASPLGILATALGAVAGVGIGLIANARATAAAQRQHAAEVAGVADRYDQLRNAYERAEPSSDEAKRLAWDLYQQQQDIARLLPEVVTRWGDHGEALALNIERYRQLTEEARKAKAATDLGGKPGDDPMQLAVQQYTEALAEQARLTRELEAARRVRDIPRSPADPDFGTSQRLAEETIRTLEQKLAELERSLPRLAAMVSREAAIAAGDAMDSGASPDDGFAIPRAPGGGDTGGGGGRDPIDAMLARISQLRQLAGLQSEVARQTGQGAAEALAVEREILTSAMDDINRAMQGLGVTATDSVQDVFARLSGATDETREKALRLKSTYEELRLALLRLSGQTRQGDITLSGAQVIGQLAVEGFRGAVQQLRSALAGGAGMVEAVQRIDWTGTLSVAFTGPGIDNLPATERDRMMQQFAAAMAAEINRDARATGVNAGLQIIFGQ